MLFVKDPANVSSVRRTIRPLYSRTQATTYAGFLAEGFNKATTQILPGEVCTKLAGETFTKMTKDTEEPFGLSDLFVTSAIDETIPSGTMTVWRGGKGAVFEVLAPAFDTTATWTRPSDGVRVPLRVTLGANGGKLTTKAAAAGSVSSKVAATLIDVVGTNKIIVELDDKANG